MKPYCFLSLSSVSFRAHIASACAGSGNERISAYEEGQKDNGMRG